MANFICIRPTIADLTTATILAITLFSSGITQAADWQRDFSDLTTCALATTGGNTYFVMEPGFQTVLESDDTKLVITVLDETKIVREIETRVIEEREWENGELYEVSRNFFAVCPDTGNIYYFGEEVDFYEGGEIVRHDGSWLAGENDAAAGLIMPSAPTVGMKYYQEFAPEIAMDRAEIYAFKESCKTPAGRFEDCLVVKEGTPLEPLLTEYKTYAPEVGLINDQNLVLVRYGYGVQ